MKFKLWFCKKGGLQSGEIIENNGGVVSTKEKVNLGDVYLKVEQQLK